MTTNQSRPRPLTAAAGLWRALLLAEQRSAAMSVAVNERRATHAERLMVLGVHRR